MQRSLPLPIPFQCIWCKRGAPLVTFETESHALPAAAGNADEVLPPGVVCDTCNRNWGKIERELSAYPLFKIGTWAVQSRNVRTGEPFCPELIDDIGTVVPLPRRSRGGIHLGIRIRENALHVEVTTAVKGDFTADYTPRRLTLLSRAVHKVAFEGLAWGMYVSHSQTTLVVVDPLSSQFDHIRAWVKMGVPQRSVRPFFQPADLTDFARIPATFGPTVYARPSSIIVQYRDGFAWYGVTLTSPPERALRDLEEWGERVPLGRALVVSDRFRLLKYPGQSPAPTA